VAAAGGCRRGGAVAGQGREGRKLSRTI